MPKYDMKTPTKDSMAFVALVGHATSTSRTSPTAAPSCGYRGYRCHYRDECHLKRPRIGRNKKAEEARRKQGARGNPGGGGRNLGAHQSKSNQGGGQWTLACPTSSQGNSNPAPPKSSKVHRRVRSVQSAPKPHRLVEAARVMEPTLRSAVSSGWPTAT